MKDKFIPALRYNWLTKIYDPIVQHTMPEEEFKKELISQANISESARILDFGCGSLTLSLMAKRLHPTADVHAVDVDEKILKIAEEKKREAHAEISIQRYEGRILPYQNNSFDRVISSLVFHHLNREQKMNALYEIHRVLKPGGEIHIADWGKAKNTFMRVAFFLIQFLDGFKTTTDNVRGLIPSFMAQAGFIETIATSQHQTVFGTLVLYKGKKSCRETIL
jgi:ubiquinone/menaquinone biosynthesis C-methylase UbiE